MSARTLSTRHFLLAGLLGLTCSIPFPAHAESPDHRQLVRLDDRLIHARKVRVTTPSGWLIAEGVRASAGGLAFRRVTETTLSQEQLAPGRISWEVTRRVDVPSNHAVAAGLVAGVVLTGLAGFTVYSAGQQGNDIGGGGIGLLAIPVLAVLAAVVGAQFHSWHPVYRMPAASSAQR